MSAGPAVYSRLYKGDDADVLVEEPTTVVSRRDVSAPQYWGRCRLLPRATLSLYSVNAGVVSRGCCAIVSDYRLLVMVVIPVRRFISRGGEVVVRSSLFRMMSCDVTHVIQVGVRKFSFDLITGIM